MENTNQPIPNQTSMMASNTPHRSNTLLIVIAIILVVLGLLVGYFLFSPKSTIHQVIKVLNLQIQISPTIVANQSTLIPTQTSDLIPQENALYLGDYEGKKAIFYTNKEEQTYYVNGPTPHASPYIGILKLANGVGITSFDYRKLENPQKIYTESNKIIIGVTFALNSKGSFLYAGVLTNTKSGLNNDHIERMYKINLITLANEEIWLHEVGSNKYPEAKGRTVINQVTDDKYLVLMLLSCDGCESSLADILILNMATRQEKYIQGKIGDIQVNPNSNTFTYKKLAPFKKPCIGSEFCDSGQITVYKPSGQTLIETLP